MNKGHEEVGIWWGHFRYKEGDKIIDLGCGGGRNVPVFFN